MLSSGGYDRDKSEKVYSAFVAAWRRDRDRITVRSLAAIVDLPKSTVHRYLGYLIEQGRLREVDCASGRAGIGRRIVPWDNDDPSG